MLRNFLALSALLVAACGGAQTKPDETSDTLTISDDNRAILDAIIDDTPSLGTSLVDEPGLGIAVVTRPHNPVTYWEICSKNPEALATFYSSVFDWSFGDRVDVGGQGMWFVNTIGPDGSGIDGGICGVDDAGEPYLTVYATVSNLDERLAAAAAAGGTVVVPPMDIGSGFFAMIVDSSGLLFGLFDHTEGLVVPEAGTTENPVVHWEIVSPEPQPIVDFYSKVFGWDANFDEEMAYTFLTTDGTVTGSLLGISGGIGSFEQHQFVSFYVASSDLAQSLAAANAAGGQTIMDVTELSPDMSVAMFSDPDGNIIGLVSR